MDVFVVNKMNKKTTFVTTLQFRHFYFENYFVSGYLRSRILLFCSFLFFFSQQQHQQQRKMEFRPLWKSFPSTLLKEKNAWNKRASITQITMPPTVVWKRTTDDWPARPQIPVGKNYVVDMTEAGNEHSVFYDKRGDPEGLGEFVGKALPSEAVFLDFTDTTWSNWAGNFAKLFKHGSNIHRYWVISERLFFHTHDGTDFANEECVTPQTLSTAVYRNRYDDPDQSVSVAMARANVLMAKGHKVAFSPARFSTSQMRRWAEECPNIEFWIDPENMMQYADEPSIETLRDLSNVRFYDMMDDDLDKRVSLFVRTTERTVPKDLLREPHEWKKTDHRKEYVCHTHPDNVDEVRQHPNVASATLILLSSM
jgi:hypothetical protein